MATLSKLSYLKRYMSKEDLEDLKMKNKVKKKVLSDLEKRKTGEKDQSTLPLKNSKQTQSSATSRKPSTKLKKRHDSDSDGSPPRKSAPGPLRMGRHDSDSDQSPPRKSMAMAEPSRKVRHDSDSDQSPPRKAMTDPSRKARHDSDSDQSPPRKSSKMASDSDQSPQRKTSTARKRHDSDSDQSPPRNRKSSPSIASSSKRGDRPSRFSDLSPPRNKAGSSKATKTMSGATAGLSSATEMKREAKVLRQKEEASFQKIGDDVLGKNAKTVVRDRETGKRRNLQAEKEEDEEKERKLEEQKQKYQQWGKGLSQQEEKERRLADHVHEASKPLARYKDDQDLDDMLRNEQRAEDPMLAFIQRKKAKEDTKNGKKAKKELPKYKGPTPPPPNRYNIQPGYRWDGVDRSNGFENKIFASINNKKAIREIAYKWSTEDM